jgi:hypothetical protein
VRLCVWLVAEPYGFRYGHWFCTTLGVPPQ